MTHYTPFLEGLTELVYEHYGKGNSFKDRRTGSLYRFGCLYLDPTKVQFLSERTGNYEIFSFDELVCLDPVEEKALV